MTKTFPIQTLMLIDDNEVDQMLCERLALRSGLVGNFIGHLSAEDALDSIRSQPMPVADVILLDVNMPRMDGFEFLDIATRELGDQFARMVVIMLTTSLDPLDQERAGQFAVVKDYCNKPLLTQHLERIAALLSEG